MNYLAHAFLSGPDKNLLVGNFIADHLRGSELHSYSPEIIRGVLLHREIDTFADTHPLFRAAKRFFYPGFEKYSGILVDIFFDHLLAMDFELYSADTLSDFSQNVYSIYTAHRHTLPGSSIRFLDYVTQNRIYESYAHEEGIERVLYHLSHRIRHNVRLDSSMPLLMQHKAELREIFRKFFHNARQTFLPDAGTAKQ